MALDVICFEADTSDQPLKAGSFTKRKKSIWFPIEVPHGFSQVSVFSVCPCLQNAQGKEESEACIYENHSVSLRSTRSACEKCSTLRYFLVK